MPVHHRYEWLYLSAFVNPETGQNLYYILPRVGTEHLSLVLEDVARELHASPSHAVLLVLDRAGWHSSGKLHVPEGIELVFLPSYSPELQPAERLWSLSDEPLANLCFDSLDSLQNLLANRCAELRQQPDLITRHTLFHWWPLV